jgi:hypothetical protein
MALDGRLRRLEQDIGEALDAAGANAYERLTPEEMALWEEMITAIRQVEGLPHGPDTVRASVKHEAIALERQGMTFTLDELRRIRDAYRRLAEREGWRMAGTREGR